MITSKSPSQTQATQESKSQSWIAIAAILGIAIVLYFYQLGTESIWVDEYYSIHDAKAAEKIAQYSRPLYYALLHVWMMFGDSDVWLRTLAIPFALGSIFFTYRLGNVLVGRPEGLVAALMMAISPIFINHAQEIRMYSLSTFLTVAGTFFLAKILETNATLPLLSGWIGMRILAVLTTPLNVLLFLPDGALLLWRLRQRYRLLLAIGGFFVVVGVLSIPWAIRFSNMSFAYFSDWVADNPKPTLVNVLSRLTNLTAYWPLQSLKSPISIHFYKLYTVMLAGLIGFALINRRPRAGVYYLFAWAGLPAAALFIVSWLFAPVWLPRYLLFVMPYVVLLIATGFIKAARSQPILASILALVYAIAVGGGLEHYYTKQFREDWRGTAQLIKQYEQPGDQIAMYVNYERSLPFIDRYYDGPAPITILDIQNWEASVPNVQSRLWLVYQDPQTETPEKFEAQVKQKFQIEDHRELATEIGWDTPIDVFLLTPKS